MDKNNAENELQKVVAIKYNPADIAPKVVAKGAGYVAGRILDRAAQNKIPIYKDAALVKELSKIELGNNIPPELYEVVAQVLIFISDLDKLATYREKGQSL